MTGETEDPPSRLSTKANASRSSGQSPCSRRIRHGGGDYRYLATGHLSGHIVDLRVEGYGIAYRIEDHGAVVWVELIFKLPYRPPQQSIWPPYL